MNDKERAQLVEDAAAALVLAGMTGDEPERDEQEVDLSAPIDGCRHTWEPDGANRLRCTGPCGVVLQGSLTSQPPEAGMDWSRAALLRSDWPVRDGAAREAEGQEVER